MDDLAQALTGSYPVSTPQTYDDLASALAATDDSAHTAMYGQPGTLGRQLRESLAGYLGGMKAMQPKTVEEAAYFAPGIGNALSARDAYNAANAGDWRGTLAGALGAVPFLGGITREAKAVTESPAFKKWFGASKVVDAEGRPLTVYHGTKADFDAFDLDEAHPDASVIWATNNKGYADWLAKQDTQTREPIKTLPMYLKLENPVEVDVFKEGANIAHELGLPAPETAREAEELYRGGGSYNDIVSQLLAEHPEADGVILENTVDGYGHIRSTQFAARHPTQFKSINNAGTFDPNDPRLLYGIGGAGMATLGSGGQQTDNKE